MTKQEMEIGTKVMLTNDFGAEYETFTLSKPWQIGSGDWLVSVEGKRGGYDLDRIRVVEQPSNQG